MTDDAMIETMARAMWSAEPKFSGVGWGEPWVQNPEPGESNSLADAYRCAALAALAALDLPARDAAMRREGMRKAAAIAEYAHEEWIRASITCGKNLVIDAHAQAAEMIAAAITAAMDEVKP